MTIRPDAPIVYDLRGTGFEYREEGATFRALQGVDLVIREGEFVAIVGASGSGKTTMMNLLGLLATPTEGSFLLEGVEVGGLPEEEKAALRNERLGFVFQHFALLPRLTVLENVLLPYRFSERRDGAALEARATALLESLGIGSKETRMPAELSGGQKQRVALCRALLMRPRVLLADEPTGALDSKTTTEELALLDDLNAAGQTIIVITHDPDVAAHARRRVTLKDGRVVEDRPQRVGEISGRPVAGADAPAVGNEGRGSSRGRNAFARAAGRVEETGARYSKTLRNAFANLRANALRSALTGLGLLIGVASIIVISGLGEVVQNVFNGLFYNAGTSKIYVWYDGPGSRASGAQSAYWPGFELRQEFPRFAAQFEKYGTFRPFVWARNCNVQSASKPARASFTGMYDSAEFTELDAPLTKGRFPSALEIARGADVAVLGSDAVDALFAKDDPARAEADFPVGQHLTVDRCEVLLNLKIIGVIGKRDTTFGNRDANDRVYAPANTLLKSMGVRTVNFFSVMPAKGVDPRWLANHVSAYLTTRAGENQRFGSGVPAEIIEKIRGFLLIIQALTGFIGGLCIVVGGIGIMNIMIVTVTERVREIGILKSQGAKPHHVRNQFIVESVLLCLLAGGAGVAVGLFVTNALAFAVSVFQPNLGEFRFVFAPGGIVVGLAVSFSCGVGFGYLPALRASRLEPAQCMREE